MQRLIASARATVRKHILCWQIFTRRNALENKASYQADNKKFDASKIIGRIGLSGECDNFDTPFVEPQGFGWDGLSSGLCDSTTIVRKKETKNENEKIQFGVFAPKCKVL